MILARTGRATRQPPPGAQIQWGHPLTRGLTCAFVPSTNLDLVHRRQASNVQWLDGFGIGGVNPYTAADDTDESTLACRLRLNADPNSYIGIYYQFYASGTDNQAEGIIWYDGINSLTIIARKNTDNIASGSLTIEGTPVSFPLTNHYAVTFSRSANTATAYRNGKLVTTASYIGAVGSPDARKTHLIGDASVGPMAVQYYYHWNRRLTVAEIAWLAVEPYVFLLSQGPIARYFLPIVPATLTPSSIATAEAFGSPEAFASSIDLAGIATAEAFATTHHLGDVTLESGLASAEAIGSLELFPGDIALRAGIASEEAVSAVGLFGAVGAAGTLTLSAGIATAEAFGSATLTDNATISPTGIPSAEDMDLHTVGAPVATILAYGIASREGFGTTSVFTLNNPADPAPGICGALAKPFRLRRAEDFIGAPEPAAILPDVYGDFTDGGLRGPIPAVLLTTAAPWLYCAAAHPVKSIDKVYIDDVEQTSGFSTSPAYPAPALTDIGQGYQTQIGTISFDAQPAGVVTWRGQGMAEDDGTLIENPIRQLEMMLRLRGLYTDSHFEAGALAQAKSDADGYTLAWVVRDDRQIQDWVTEVLFNVLGYWRVNGRGELAIGIDTGGGFARSDIAASFVAARDCLNGDDGVEITFDRRNLVNRLSVYFMHDWSTDLPADIAVLVEDAASVNAHGEARKSLVLKGHRTSAQVTTWGTALLTRQSFATRVEGAIVRFITTDARAMHLSVGDLIAFTWPYGPTRELGHAYTNEILRVVAIAQDATRGGATTLEAVDTGEYVTDDAGARLLTALA